MWTLGVWMASYKDQYCNDWHVFSVRDVDDLDNHMARIRHVAFMNVGLGLLFIVRVWP